MPRLSSDDLLVGNAERQKGADCARWRQVSDPFCELSGIQKVPETQRLKNKSGEHAMTERTLFLGVDPGGSGGLAVIDRRGAIVEACAMPATPRDVHEWFGEFGPRVIFGLIEIVHAMPARKNKKGEDSEETGGQGVVSAFKFGWNTGLLHMALVPLPHEGVLPGKWQQGFGLIRKSKTESRTDKKNRHKAVAQELFPTLPAGLKKITHAVADALLIAEYCRRTHIHLD
jgi:hypothetical protein